MHIINFFILPIILVSIFYNSIKFSYVISFLCSLGAATFVYAEQNLANIIFTIAIFNTTPLICLCFNRVRGNFRLSLEKSKTAQRQSYQQILKERSIIRQSSSQLSKDVSRVVELYKMTRDMSAVLGFAEIFDILGKQLMQNFHFKSCRLILTDEDAGALKIKRVLELVYSRAHIRQVEQTAEDEQILKQALGGQKIESIKEKSLTLVPLFVNSKFLGALAVEALPPGALEHFSILANHFSLEFKRIRLYQKLQELAITDGLTGLFVRRYFLERLAEEVGRSTRHHLKLAFLREVAAKIKACVREIDLTARYGGEEFSVLLPDTDKAGAGFVAERIRSTIAKQKISAYDENISVELSIGVAIFPEDSTTPQELIDKADQALYRAKQEGRNRVEFF